jgi:hypothetical protein
MEFLITESQLRTLLSEEERSQLGSYMKQLNAFTRQIVSRVAKSYGLNLRMLLTWGTSVGGMVLPLDEFLKTGDFNLTEEQRMLVLSGIAFSLFFESRRSITKLLSTIKDEGLEDVYKKGLKKGKELKTAFIDFVESLSVGTSLFVDTIAYSFLIPIINDIYSVTLNSQDLEEAAILIAERLLSSGIILGSSQILVKVVKSILERLK